MFDPMNTRIVSAICSQIALLATVCVFLFGTLLTGCSSPADAQASGDVLTWVNPTLRTDGTPFTTQADTLVMWGTAAGGPYAAGSQIVPFPAATVTIPRASPSGTVCYVTIARDTPVTDPVTKAVTQLVSANSNEVCKTIIAVPKPPSGLTIK